MDFRTEILRQAPVRKVVEDSCMEYDVRLQQGRYDSCLAREIMADYRVMADFNIKFWQVPVWYGEIMACCSYWKLWQAVGAF